MRGTWDGDSITEPGYLVDGEWPSHEEDDEDTGLPGPQQIDVDLAMGGTRSVWRPEWKKIGEERSAAHHLSCLYPTTNHRDKRSIRWSPFVNEVAARVVNTWKMTNGDRPTVNDLKPLIIKYCKNRSGVRPTSAEEGGVHLARLVARKRGHVSPLTDTIDVSLWSVIMQAYRRSCCLSPLLPHRYPMTGTRSGRSPLPTCVERPRFTLC